MFVNALNRNWLTTSRAVLAEQHELLKDNKTTRQTTAVTFVPRHRAKSDGQ